MNLKNTKFYITTNISNPQIIVSPSNIFYNFAEYNLSFQFMAFFNSIVENIKSIGNISEHIDTEAAEKAIRSNITFKGPNAWILAFAIIIASVGLNVNSIPVIIGAMLISPLMGPIFGIGLGLGINDFDLLKASLKNLLVMMGISLVASLIYFLITPLSLANPTELLARTNPTIYDVLIALFGGLAGIFEQSRKEKGTVFSGVAIATALMPPLCTAGFGLASGNLRYFIGALYLFIINCIFIILATYVMVKYLRFHTKEFTDEKLAKRTKTISTLLIIIFIVPSILSAVNMVKQTNFEKKAEQFISENRNNGGSIIYDYRISHIDGSKIELFFTGESLDPTFKANLYEKAKEYGLKEDQIIISEHTSRNDNTDVDLIRGIYERTDSELGKKDAEIERLQKEIQKMKEDEIPYVQLTKEITLSYPQISKIYLLKGASVVKDSLMQNPCIVAIPVCSTELKQEEKIRLTEWLKIRLASENVELIPLAE